MAIKTTVMPALVCALCVNCRSVPSHLSGDDFIHTENRYGGTTILEYRGPGKNIIIPKTINGLPITVIGRAAFAGRGIINVTLPETIIRIEDRAFMNNKLKNAAFPTGLEFIGDEAFKGNRLETVNLPEGITEIGYRSFAKNKLTEAKLPKSLKNTGDYCFADNRVKSVEFPENTDTVPAGMFARNGITVLRLPVTVKRIGRKAFVGNPIEAVSFWGGEYVGKDAFADTRLKVVGIAEKVRFDSPREMGLGFQTAYRSMSRKAGIYYRQTGDIWWIKDD
jgi:hypothetical protein